ncbi:hypothetical protein [Desulfocurvus sp. DL9XJH121]
MQVKSIPSQVVVKLAACVLTLALLVVAVLLPQHKSILGLRADVASAKADIRRQTALMPTYAKLLSQVNKGLPESVPPPRELRVTRDGITDIRTIFVDAAKARSVFPESVIPDPSSLATDGNALSVDCVFHGSLESLRGLLLDLGALSSLHSLEQVHVREEGREAVMRVKAWMNLD